MRDDEPLELDDDRPRRKRRSDSPGTPGWVWILLGVGGAFVVGVVVVCGGMLWFGGKAVEKEAEKAQTREPEFTLSADELLPMIAENPASTTKYHDKMVRIEGRLGRVDSNIEGKFYLTFAGKGISPRCFFRDSAVIANLKKDDPVSVIGLIHAGPGTVDVSECRLVGQR